MRVPIEVWTQRKAGRHLHRLGSKLLACLTLLAAAGVPLAPGAAASGRSEESAEVIAGNVTFAAMYEFNELENEACGSFVIGNVQELMAVKWFLDRVNAMNYIPGVRLGLEVFRTCKQPQRAASHAVQLLSKYGVGKPAEDISNFLFGLLGPSRTSDAMAVSGLIGHLPANQQVLQMSGSSTGKELSDRDQFRNFFRVIPPDNIQVQVMLGLMERLKWNYVAIVYVDDAYGRSAASELRQLGKERGVCDSLVDGSLPLDPRSKSFTLKAELIAQQIKDNITLAVVIVGGSSLTKEFIRILNSKVRFPQLVLSESIALSVDTFQAEVGNALAAISKGSLVTSPVYTNVLEFHLFWQDLWRNKSLFQEQSASVPWLEAYLYEQGKCPDSRTLESCWDDAGKWKVQQNAAQNVDLFASYEMKAAAVLTKLLKQAHDKLCQGQIGLCPALQNYIQERQTLLNDMNLACLNLSDFSPVSSFFHTMPQLTFNGSDLQLKEGDTEYIVYNFRETPRGTGNFTFHQIGSYVGQVLSLDANKAEFYDEASQPVNLTQLLPAQCPAKRNCLECVRSVSDDVILLDGDFYIIGLVAASEKDPANLLGCGEVRSLGGSDLAEALVFAVNHINNDSSFTELLSNSRLGLLVINTCGSPMHLRQQLLAFFSGRLSLPDGTTSGRLVSQLAGVVGPLFSDDSIATSDTLTSLQVPSFAVVSPGSTSTELKNRQRHPYFLRLVPPDDIQAMAMLDIVQRLGGNYIQVVYDSSTVYATNLHQNLLDLTAASSGNSSVCVAQSVPSVPQTVASNYNFILDRLRRYPAARIVIIVLHLSEADRVLNQIVPQLSSQDQFLFIGCESWGRRLDISRLTSLKGSLVLSQEIARDRHFDDYFKKQSVTSASSTTFTINPWLRLFWENRLRCFLDKSFMRSNRLSCPQEFAESYEQDSRVPLYIQATYAFVQGFAAALTDKCGKNARRICPELTSQDLVDQTKKVQLDLYDSGRLDKVFDNNGDGLVAFKVLRIGRNDATSADDVTYFDVGSWSPKDGLRLSGDITPPSGAAFTSVWPNEQERSRCFAQRSPVASKEAPDTVPAASLIAVVVVAAVVIVVIVISFLVYRRWTIRQRPRFSHDCKCQFVLAGTPDAFAHGGGGRSNPVFSSRETEGGSTPPPTSQRLTTRLLPPSPQGSEVDLEQYASLEAMTAMRQQQQQVETDSGGACADPPGSSSAGSREAEPELSVQPAACRSRPQPPGAGYITPVPEHGENGGLYPHTLDHSTLQLYI